MLSFIVFLGCGRFIYYEASGAQPGNKGSIATQRKMTTNKTNCLHFNLNMFAKDPRGMGSIDVYQYQPGGPTTKIFHHTGVSDSKGQNIWTEKNIDVTIANIKLPFWVSRSCLIFRYFRNAWAANLLLISGDPGFVLYRLIG